MNNRAKWFLFSVAMLLPLTTGVTCAESVGKSAATSFFNALATGVANFLVGLVTAG